MLIHKLVHDHGFICLIPYFLVEMRAVISVFAVQLCIYLTAYIKDFLSALTAQYGSYYPHVVILCLKRGQCT